ncbi:MAG: ABC transporter permease, partial [Isosphaeraceae bacterium]
ITQQLSIFCGLMLRTCAQISDITGADLWVMEPSVRFVDDVKPMLESNLQRVRGVEGVKWAVPLYKGNGRAKLVFKPEEMKEKTYPADRLRLDRQTKARPPGNPFTAVLDLLAPGIDYPVAPPARWYDEQITNVIEQVILIGVDDTSMVGAPPRGPMVGEPGDGQPRGRMLVGDPEALRRPDSVIVDRVGLLKLFPGCQLEEPFEKPKESDQDYIERLRKFVAAAPEIEMNDRRAIIVGVCEATRTFQSNPVVYTLYSRAKQFVPMERKILSFILVRTDSTSGPDGKEQKIPPEIVADRIQSQTGLGARTSEKFMYKTMKYYLIYTGIPINFGITVFLGFLVGTAIAGQTFYNFTIENLKQFGALKAMGASNLKIVSMILLQAAVVGAMGYGLGVGLSALFGLKVATGWQGQPTELAYFTPWQLLPTTAAAIVLICVLASLLSVQRVIRLEPAIVFR